MKTTVDINNDKLVKQIVFSYDFFVLLTLVSCSSKIYEK